MDLEKHIGKQSLPSVLNNPFSKDMITRVYVSFGKHSFSDKWEANGLVEFHNGNTKGEQRFSGVSFDDVVDQIKAMVNEFEEQK